MRLIYIKERKTSSNAYRKSLKDKVNDAIRKEKLSPVGKDWAKKRQEELKQKRRLQR